ncbi:DNA cytosine methyltransferase [Lacrimispora sp.]|uniref:DNA cytosine methyltransferase n=1 Tax=Lacrimispora sp. TaxID=2719234 RepID=UPI002FDB0C2C
MNAIDFFCGGGGTTRGLINAGIDVIFGLDNNPSCRETYEYNNGVPYLCHSIQEVEAQNLVADFPVLADNDNLLMVGCAPCQPFSSQRKSPIPHTARNLLDEFGRIVEELLPAHVLIENVPLIRSRGYDVLQRFLDLLDQLGFHYTYLTVNAKNYGVPQSRKRFVLMASRFFVPTIPLPTHGRNLLPYVTVRDAIQRFPELMAGERHEEIPNHNASRVSEINLERLNATPHDGGDRRAWPEELVLNCHTNYNGHTDVYGRMFWDRVSPTLTSKCCSISNGRFGHPIQNRAISFREAAALQSFPDNYIFFGGSQEIGRQIGNAVPVLLSQAMGEYILNMHKEI